MNLVDVTRAELDIGDRIMAKHLNDAMDDYVFTVARERPPIELPTEPGTVIAIGEWWFVRLRPYTPTTPAAWEFLPAPENVAERLKRQGIATQCVYSDEWVRAEAEQDGYRMISRPVTDNQEGLNP